jgi:hypothetical protein
MGYKTVQHRLSVDIIGIPSMGPLIAVLPESLSSDALPTPAPGDLVTNASITVGSCIPHNGVVDSWFSS